MKQAAAKKKEKIQKAKEKQEINQLIDEFTFEDTVNFLQEKIRQSFLDLEEDRKGEEKKVQLLKKINNQIETLSKENWYLRNNNFAMTKSLRKNEGKIKKIKKLNKESRQVKKELSKQIKDIKKHIDQAKEVLGRNSLMHVIGEKEARIVSPSERNRRIKIQSHLKESKMNAGEHSFLASDARASLARAAVGENAKQKISANPLTIPGTQSVSNFQLTESSNMMDIKVALKLRDNQMIYEDQDGKNSGRSLGSMDSDTERDQKTGQVIDRLDLSKLKGNNMEDVNININLAKTMNQSSDIFQSRGLKLHNSSYVKYKPNASGGDNQDLAMDIKNLNKLNPVDPDDLRNEVKISRRAE